MLDDFKETQPVAYKTLINVVLTNRLSHAYLIESNNYYRKDDLVLAFAKYLLCGSHHHEVTPNFKCPTCQQVQDGNHTELKIIEPDGLWIKKSQMVDLQDTFSKKAIVGTSKIYIIKEAEKMNQQSANAILKFLEEPEANIIAILVSDNIYAMPETIRSRCQIISLIGEDNIYKNKYSNYENYLVEIANFFAKNEEAFIKNLTDDKLIKNIEKTLEFIVKTDASKNNIIEVNNYFKDVNKEELSMFFDIMLLFYKDVLNVILDKDPNIFDHHEDIINKICINNDTISISEKIKKIIDLKKRIRSNVNINLLVDRFMFNGGK